MTPAHSFYDEKIKYYASTISLLQKRLAGIATLRFAAFSGLAISTWFLIKGFSYPTLVLLLIFLLAFILLIRLNFRLKDRRALLQQLLFVNTNERHVLDHRPNDFPDGKEWLSAVPYGDDLDIFGPRSLFHLLNRTTTSHGKEQLAGLLTHPLSDTAVISKYQAAIRILTQQPDGRQLLTARGLLASEKEGNLHSLGSWLSMPTVISHNKILRFFIWVIIAYNLGSIFFYLYSDNYLPLLLGIIVSWVITGSFSGRISQQHLMISKRQAILDQYAAILAGFNVMDTGDATLLRDLQGRTKEAHTAIGRLSQLASFFDQRMNVLVNIFLNSFIFYDLQCMIALEKWRETNAALFPEWIRAVGSIECLNSISSFAFNNPDATYPSPVAGADLFIDARALAHPLIPATERVPNDCHIGRAERLVLVTGSNMSGKTTFLRTIGVNLLLAQCGAPVCARSFSFSPMHLLTSLRVSDSLQEHTSYFMAELKKLQQIVHQLQTGAPALVLIDEILRGTNSEDKTYGSEQFIRKLLHYHCLSLFASHDLSLGSLEKELPGQISNYCFESVIDGDELHFNYLLQKGIARNRNASFLMKKMEII